MGITANAQDNASDPKKSNPPPAASDADAGILPVLDYSGGFWERSFLTGDWGGARTDLANKGVQFGVDWNQYVQGVADGGRDQTTEYGGKGDYTLNLDLMRMGVLKGALIKFRAESRYGSSVNSPSGALLPVNTDAFFPIASKRDRDIPVTITDLNYTQFLSKHLGVFLGKLDTLDADPNEFASGRGTSQFMNANFVFNASVALRLPYSTLGGGLVWMPVPPGPKGGVTISSMVIDTADSSTTTGFDDFDKGQTWYTEADFKYRLGRLPGGMNLGGLYSFNQDFAHLNSRLVFQPGEGLSIPKEDSTWAGFVSAWQYLFARERDKIPVHLSNGEADRKGVGLFARFGFADKNTNPLEWAASGGVGGRGIFPTRDNDTFGLGYYYNSIREVAALRPLGIGRLSPGI